MQVKKSDGEVILLNEDQVKHIVFRPKIEVVLVNGDSCPVKEVRVCKICKNSGKGRKRP